MIVAPDGPAMLTVSVCWVLGSGAQCSPREKENMRNCTVRKRFPGKR